MSFRGKRTLYNTLSAIAIVLLMTFSFFLLVSLVFNMVYIKTYVQGHSMLPTLNSEMPYSDKDGDIIYINTLSDYTTNDIVVAEVNWWNKGPIIKRLVGCPGDIIEIREEDNCYSLYVNEELLYKKSKSYNVNEHQGDPSKHFDAYEKFLEEHPENVGTTLDGNRCIKLNKDEYFLIGDNWGNSTDCLYNGPIKSKQIVGNVDLVIPYNSDNQFITLFGFMMRKVFC